MDSGAAQQAEQLKPAFERKDDNFIVVGKTSPDKLKLFVDIKRATPESTGALTLEGLRKYLEGVRSDFLHEQILLHIVKEVNDGKEIVERRVARGRAAEEGRDGKVLLLVKKLANTKGGAIEFVDPRFMKTFDNVEKGTLVARVYPPFSGAEGCDVFGQPIKPKPGKPVKVSFDNKTISTKPASTEANFDTLIAECAGYVTEEQGKLIVKEELAVSGDVNFKTGDIEFVGAVKIAGDIGKDFRVTARKDVTVNGNGQNGSAISEQGAITIKGSAFGSQLTMVSAADMANAETFRQQTQSPVNYRCAGVFSVTTAQGVSIDATGNVEIKKEANGCLIRTRGLLNMPSGHLIGGQAYIVCGVEAKIIGSKLGGKTEIFLCSDIESSAEYGDIIFQLHTSKAAEEMLKLHLGPYAENPSRLAFLKEPLQSKQKKLYQKLIQIKDANHALETRRLALLKNAHHNPTLRVNFHEKLYRGVIVYAGADSFTPDIDLQGPGTVEYLPAVKKFVISELKPIVCVVEEQQTKKRE